MLDNRSHYKQRGELKTAKLPIKIEPDQKPARKPAWIRAKAPTDPKVLALKRLLREQQLHTVCEEAACPNLGECFAKGTATFMILGDICTRRCPFCDVAHGRPNAVNEQEPYRLATTAAKMGLSYIVITSVDRDDLADGGAAHFAACIQAIRDKMSNVQIEALVPDFKFKQQAALAALSKAIPDVFNHNLETVPRLYKTVRPVADYAGSLALLHAFKKEHPDVPTKSGLMLGLGEKIDEVKQVLRDLRAHDCDMLTIGQYLQPSRYHLPVTRFVTPAEFADLAGYADSLGFLNVASGPMVRSSYHAEQQAAGHALPLT